MFCINLNQYLCMQRELSLLNAFEYAICDLTERLLYLIEVHRIDFDEADAILFGEICTFVKTDDPLIF